MKSTFLLAWSVLVMLAAVQAQPKYGLQSISDCRNGVDSFSLRGSMIGCFRYNERDLQELERTGGSTGRNATTLINLQNLLNKIRNNKRYSGNIWDIKKAWQLLKVIRANCHDCNYTAYKPELWWYSSYAPVIDAPYQEQDATYQLQNDIIDSEDPNTITEFDRAVVKNPGKEYEKMFLPWGKVQRKISMINMRERDRLLDSIQHVDDSTLHVADSLKTLAAKNKQKQKKARESAMNQAKTATLTAKFGKVNAARLLQGELWIGMEDKMVAAAWGKPYQIQKNVNAKTITEIWHYHYRPSGTCSEFSITFKNHWLTNWKQNTKGLR
jgi:hypothetical protein